MQSKGPSLGHDGGTEAFQNSSTPVVHRNARCRASIVLERAERAVQHECQRQSFAKRRASWRCSFIFFSLALLLSSDGGQSNFGDQEVSPPRRPATVPSRSRRTGE